MADQERCERTELLVAECAHCRPASNIDRPHSRPVKRDGYVFHAAYEGSCVGCNEPIYVDDRIRRTDDGYEHEHC